MILQELISLLEEADPEQVVSEGFAEPHSWRGDYGQLAFCRAQDVTVGSMLAYAKSARDETFTGYKGGDFTMRGSTECHVAEHGEYPGEPLTSGTVEHILSCGQTEELRRALYKAGDALQKCVYLLEGTGCTGNDRAIIESAIQAVEDALPEGYVSPEYEEGES